MSTGIKLGIIFTAIAATTIATFSSVHANPISPLVAQAYTQDIQGWNGTRWGMSVNEVRAIFPGIQAGEPSATGNPRFVLSNFAVNGLTYKVSFVFDKSGLMAVNLSQEGSRAVLSASMLLQDLQEKYGRPAAKNSLGTIKWILPSTEISLLSIGDMTILSYTPKLTRQDI
jgi:hypothetical protein